MSNPTVSLLRQIDILRQALSSDKNKVAFFLGAGCPVSIRIETGSDKAPLIPDIAGLTALVCGKLAGNRINEVKGRIQIPNGKGATIEDILSHVRLLLEVVGEGSIDDFSKDDLETLEKSICAEITQAVNKELPTEETPYHNLASWIRSISRNNPVEVFSPNYDLLTESALEDQRIPYFDGFIGSRRAFFDLHSIDHEKLPSRWVRLWKLHGSINWWNDTDGNVFRGHSNAGSENKQMIYPSHLKYNQSRRLPYLAMQDRLGNFLSSGQSVLVTNGYSFVDQHLNEIIVQKLSANPRAVCFGLLYGDLEDYPEALESARKTSNLILIAQDSAFIGREKRVWQIQDGADTQQYNCCIEVQKTESPEEQKVLCQLGDFNGLGKFLLNQTSNSHKED